MEFADSAFSEKCKPVKFYAMMQVFVWRLHSQSRFGVSISTSCFHVHTSSRHQVVVKIHISDFSSQHVFRLSMLFNTDRFSCQFVHVYFKFKFMLCLSSFRILIVVLVHFLYIHCLLFLAVFTLLGCRGSPDYKLL